MTLEEPIKFKYSNIHMWLKKHFGSATMCENPDCKHIAKRFEFALIKGKEYDKNRNNFIQLCPSCHRKYDFTEKQRENMSKAHIGLESCMRVKIIQSRGLKEIKRFDSISEAAKELGILRSSISNVLIGRSKSAGGYNWKYL